MEQKNPPELEESSETKTKIEKMDFDTLLVEELGEFGCFQWRILFLLGIATIFMSWGGNEYVFTAARIPTRCLIPECEYEKENVEMYPEWLPQAVPGLTPSDFDNCQRYANTTNFVESDVNETCPAHFFDKNTTLPCEEYVYLTSDTVVYDYNLGCNEWLRSLIGTVRTTGMLVGLPLNGFISDHWGRRIAFTLSIVNGAWLGVARYWANTYIGFVISEVVECIIGAGAFSTAYIIKFASPKYRVAAGASITSFYSIGQVFLGFLAWAVPDWRDLTLAVYVPQLLFVIYFWIAPESVRWLISKKRYVEAEKVLHKMARTNGKTLSEKSIELLKEHAEEERRSSALAKEQRSHEPPLIQQVFKHKTILLRCCVSPVWWITMTTIYYGLTINAVNISGNKYWNYIFVTAIELPGFWLAVLLMSRIGRKPVMAIAFWVCCACQIAYIFMPDGLLIVSLGVYMTGKCAIAMVVICNYVYTSELYPTKYRHRLFAFSSVLGRIGAILAPLTPAFGDTITFALFASLSFLAGALVFTTPETFGTKYADTMEEAVNIGKDPNMVLKTFNKQ